MCIIQLSFESGLTEHRKKALIVSVLVLYNICLNSVSLLYKVLTTVLGRRGGGEEGFKRPLNHSSLYFDSRRLSLRCSPHFSSLLYSALLSCPVFTRSHLSSRLFTPLLSPRRLYCSLLNLYSPLFLSSPFVSSPFLPSFFFFFPILGLGLICKARDISLQRTTLMRLEPALAYRDLPLKNLTSLIMLAKHAQ